MDMDKAHDRVFIGCRSGVFAVVNGGTGQVITTMPIGPGVDATEFDTATGSIYVSSGGDGSLSIFHEGRARQVFVGREGDDRARRSDPGRDHKTGRVYLPVGRFGRLPRAVADEVP